MSVKSPKSTKELIAHQETLVSRIKQQQQILHQVRGLLDPVCASHCMHAMIKADQLILFSDGPVWTSRLRFQSSQLLQSMRAHYPTLSQVKIRAYVNPQAATAVWRKATLPSPARSTLEEAASSIDNPELSQALLRLSRIKRN